MTPQIALFLVLLVITLILFSMERLPVDVIAIGVMITLVLTGLLPANRAFAGFGSETFMLLFGLLILTSALTRTGVIDMISSALLRYAGNHPGRLGLALMVATGSLSTVMSNTAATAFFLPAALGLGIKTRTPVSKLLLPIAFASILASSVTLLSTSTNIVVSGLIQQYDLPPMGMFELTPIGLPILIIGLLYMAFIGIRLLPNREARDGERSALGLRVYLTEVVVLPNSPLIGRSLRDSNLGRDLGLTVASVVRGKETFFVPATDLIVQSGDSLIVEGMRDDILKIKDAAGVDIKADVKLNDPALNQAEMMIVEVILLSGSPLVGRTLKRFVFRDRYGLQVLAINRNGETMRTKLSEIILRMGDILLIQGRRENIILLQEDKSFSIVGEVMHQRPLYRRAPQALVIFAGALLLATFTEIPLSVCALMGALAAFLTRCVTPDEAYRDMDWRVLILVGGMLAFGAAMEGTGTAAFLASQLVGWTQGLDPRWLLLGFFVLTMLLTQPMSNQAAAAVVIPVAVQTALQLGLNPRTFAMMIAIGASCSFLTPLEPSCLMVYGPGNYRFMDFLKVGALLTVIIAVVAVVFVPVIWPFSAV